MNLRLSILFCAVLIFMTGCSNAPIEPGKHLFVLSGQSNMTGVLKKAFTEKVEQQLGAENVEVVISMRSGRGLRFWVKDYQYSRGNKLPAKKDRSNGEEYPRLFKVAKDALDKEEFKTVSFIWMQGESDACSKNGLYKVYDVNFKKFYRKLKGDLKLDKMYFVIGRISDFGLRKNTKNYSDERAMQWKEVRKFQVHCAESHKDGAWIDTDDLIDETNLHYLGDKREKLGNRFADKAVEQLVKRCGKHVLLKNRLKSDKGE